LWVFRDKNKISREGVGVKKPNQIKSKFYKFNGKVLEDMRRHENEAEAQRLTSGAN
jgi:hypothetical protein